MAIRSSPSNLSHNEREVVGHGYSCEIPFRSGVPVGMAVLQWIREVDKVRDIEVEWRLFSLQLINDKNEDPLSDGHVRGTRALRTTALVGEREETTRWGAFTRS